MGILESYQTRRCVMLGTRNLIGRSRTCVVNLQDVRVSAEHAVIFWNAEGWHLRDLGSRNGTWVDGKRITLGSAVALSAGATLTFGSEAERWCVVDDRPPAVGAREQATGRLVQAVEGRLGLPDDRTSVAELSNQEGRWLLCCDGRTAPAYDQQLVEVLGVSWVLQIPETALAPADTLQARQSAVVPLDSIGLRFEVSRDQEYVAVGVQVKNTIRPLPARAHNELLLVLARLRLQDRAQGTPESECGWVYTSVLATMMAQDQTRLNVAVFRARQQLAEAGVEDSTQVIERRKTTQQLRIGVAKLEVVEPLGVRDTEPPQPATDIEMAQGAPGPTPKSD
jgi:hypothetical protein